MAKRGQGEGTISKREDGTWWARITLGKDENGKQKRKAFYGKTRKEVQEKLTAALNDINNDTYIEPSKMTVAQWMDIWLKDYKKTTIRASTYYLLDCHNRCYITPKLGNYKLKDLRNDIIQKFINEVAASGVSVEYTNRISCELYSALEQARKNDMISKNPSVDVKKPSRNQEDVKRVLTVKEQELFVAETQKENYENYGKMFLFILCTGLRIGEALVLAWDDIDFEDETVFISKTLTLTKDPDDPTADYWGVGAAKTRASVRKIPLIPSMIRLLREIQKAQNEDKKQFGNAYQDSNFIFCNRFGQILNKSTCSQKLKNILLSIGTPIKEKITPHSLRHTFATRSLENGIELKVLQDLMGHASITMTADLYVHVLPDKKRESIMKLQDTIKF